MCPRSEWKYTIPCRESAGEDRTEIKFMQLAGLLDLPIRLGCLRHVVFGDQVDIFEFKTVFTLFELIDGIAWQLSFHGSPGTVRTREVTHV